MIGGNRPFLQTHGLCLSFGKVRAVHNLDLTVREGEIYGFLGRNGAGKTSTIRMLMGVVRPDDGEIQLEDFRGKRIGIKQKRRIGYVSQEQNFYAWMSCAQLGQFVSGFYPNWDRSEFKRLLMLLDLPPKRKVSHLSGGMRVKLALSVALAHRPPILILDEPTSGLDPVARREFLDIIHQQARSHGRTTFFSSHLIDEVELAADRIGIIKRGEMCYEGDVAGLRHTVRGVRVPVDVPREDFLSEAAKAGFKSLDGRTGDQDSVPLLGSLESWQGCPFDASQIHELSLEEVFIALVGEPTQNL